MSFLYIKWILFNGQHVRLFLFEFLSSHRYCQGQARVRDTLTRLIKTLFLIQIKILLKINIINFYILFTRLSEVFEQDVLLPDSNTCYNTMEK